MKKNMHSKEELHFNGFIDWLIYIISYTLILFLMSIIFQKSFYVENILWALIASLIIYLLNKTIKPLIFFFTLPITGLTLGLFYPFINVFILYITSFILTTSHFKLNNIWMVLLIAVIISLLNILVESIKNKLLRREQV